MKKSISLFLALVLVMVLSVSPQPIYAEPLFKLSVEATDNIAKPISYLSEYNQYFNIIGCLNSDGTKTIYLFGDSVEEQDIENVTGLELPSSMIRSDTTTTVNPYVYDDTTVYENTPNTNYCTYEYFEVGNNPTKGVAQTYIRFDLSELSSTITSDNIISAYYHFYSIDDENDYIDIDAYLVTEDWAEHGIAWSNRPDYYAGEKLGTLNFQTNDDLDEFPNDLYLTKAVKAWIQGVPNYGICLKQSDYASSDSQLYCQFASADNIDSYPYLCITYADEVLTQTPGIVSGQNYYVVNKNSGKYLHANSLISGTNVYQTAGTGAALQHWTVTYLNNGYYSIRVNNTTACLEVLNGGTGNGVDIRVGSYTGADKQQWKVVRNWNGSYRIIPKLAPTKAVLVGTSSMSNGDNVYQATYTHNFTFNDDWSLVSVAGGEASAFCFTSAATGDIDTTANMDSLANYINNSRFTTNVYTNQSATVGMNKLQQSPIFIFSGHGFSSAFFFYESPNSVSSISTIPFVGVDDLLIDTLAANGLAHQKLMLIQSCLTGASCENTNLVGQMYRLGSHNIISNTCETSVGPDADWLWMFFVSLYISNTIGISKERADEYVYDNYPCRHGGILQRHDLGDDSVRLLGSPASLVATSQYTYTLPSVNSRNRLSIVDYTGMSYIGTQKKAVYGDEFHVYCDENGGIYTIEKGTGQLRSYQPYLGNLKIGDTIISYDKAFAFANKFLDNMGYDTTEFACEHSNSYSKTYRIAYKYLLNGSETSEKIVLYMQADESGNVYLTNFMVEDYGMFSQDVISNQTKIVSETTDSQIMQTIKANYGENTTIEHVYWTKDEHGTIIKKALITVKENKSYISRVVDF